MHLNAPALETQADFPRNIIDQALLLAGNTCEQTRPFAFYELLATILVYVGTFERKRIEAAMRSFHRWPNSLSTVTIQGQKVNAKLGKIEMQKAIDLAYAIAQKVHPMPLLQEGGDNPFTSDTFDPNNEALLTISNGQYELGPYFLNEDRSIPPSPHYLFVFLLTRSTALQTHIQTVTKQTILEFREK